MLKYQPTPVAALGVFVIYATSPQFASKGERQHTCLLFEDHNHDDDDDGDDDHEYNYDDEDNDYEHGDAGHNNRDLVDSGTANSDAGVVQDDKGQEEEEQRQELAHQDEREYQRVSRSSNLN